MKKSNLLMAGVALAFLTGGVGSTLAQAQGVSASDTNPYNRKKNTHGHAARTDIQNTGYRPLTVSPNGAGPGGVIGGVGAGVGGLVGGIGTGVGTGVNGALGGVGTIVAAPFNGLAGGPVGISGDAAPPLPIKARFANTGPVTDSIEQGYAQPVPVDRSGPIYMLDKDAKSRSVTPFSLIAYPLTGVTSIISSPLRGRPPGAL